MDECAGRQVMEPDEIDVLAASVLRNLQQIRDAREPRLARDLVRDVVESDLLDGVDFDLPRAQPIAVSDLHPRRHPDADAARDLAGANGVAQVFRELHLPMLMPDGAAAGN